MIGLTEHPMSDGTRVVTAINYSPADIQEQITLRPPWNLKKVIHGPGVRQSPEGLTCAIRHNDGVVFLIKRGDRS